MSIPKNSGFELGEKAYPWSYVHANLPCLNHMWCPTESHPPPVPNWVFFLGNAQQQKRNPTNENAALEQKAGLTDMSDRRVLALAALWPAPPSAQQALVRLQGRPGCCSAPSPRRDIHCSPPQGYSLPSHLHSHPSQNLTQSREKKEWKRMRKEKRKAKLTMVCWQLQ